MTIWKFPLEVTDSQYVDMPRGARVLSAQVQGGALCMWALVSPGNGMERREVVICGTGNVVDHAMHLEFVGTVQTPAFVWHVFITATGTRG